MTDSDQGEPSLCLEACALECIRGNRVLFRDLELRIEAGEVIQVAGANGSGKTSLLRLLCGLGVPTHGAITWCGQNIRQIRAEYLAEVTYVGHLPGIKLDLSPEENLTMDRALNGGRKDVDNRSILERLKLQNFIDTPCRYLSAGQKRRVALAKLMFGHASLWLLDEPLTAIDQSGVDDLTMVISDFVGGGGMVVMTSHQSISLQGRELRTVVLGQ